MHQGGGAAEPLHPRESGSNCSGWSHGRRCTLPSKELAPIVVVCAIWGPGWRGKTVRYLCDNAAVVAILRSGTNIRW